MKDFFKYVLATIVGMIATAVLVILLCFVGVVGIISSGETMKSVKDNSILVLNLEGDIPEKTQYNPLASLLGNGLNQMGLNDILSAIKKAKNNDNISGIYISTGLLSTGYSTLKEIRDALLDFKDSGKWIYAYGDTYTQGAYYVASVADSLYLNPSGQVDIHGIASQTVYVKDLYAKFGVKFQIIKVGKYKSATEVYSEDHMSEANKEQVRAYVNGIWDNVATAIAEGRHTNKDSINILADKFTAFISPDELLKYGLVDGLLYSDGMKAQVKKTLGIKENNEISQLSVADMTKVKGEKKSGSQIAVYYAEGTIIDSSTEGIPLWGATEIVGDKVCKDMEKLLKDDDVKAVVIRVNSPGGSAYASEQIWHAITTLKEEKPVVVSMGDRAASGGYYISCNASWIVAQPTTLTGSIGIYGIVPEASELLTKKLSLHFDGVKTNEYADLGSNLLSFTIRPLDTYENDMLQKYIDRGYSLFRQRVADGRKKTLNEIEEIAQGHVWLGQDAIDIGLVDQLGGLDDAIDKAVELAQCEGYYTKEYPEEGDWIDMLFSSDSANRYLDDKVKTLLGEWYVPFKYIKAISSQSPIQAIMPYFITIN